MGIRVGWAARGDGITSMTVWMMAVERGSHWVNISERRLLRSLEFKSRGGILRFRVETILLIFSAFLRPPTVRQPWRTSGQKKK